jgi:DNA-binding NarL/FixJ family response regulator
MAQQIRNRDTGAGAAAKRVMLVEDHEHVLWGLRKLIHGERPRMAVCAVARTVTQAQAALREHAPDVVVLDLFLAGENALERLPAALEASGAAWIVLTDARDAVLHRRAYQCGALAVVLKDEPAEVLLAHIERALRKHAARNEPGQLPPANELPDPAAPVAISAAEFTSKESLT